MVRIKRQRVRARRKDREPSRKKKLSVKTTAKFILGVIIIGAIGFLFASFKYMFVESDHFLVKGVEVISYDEKGNLSTISLDEFRGSGIVGANIFTIDLNELKKRIEERHLEFKDIVVTRTLPNKIIVQVELRKAIAQLRSDRYYLIDKEGVILPYVKNFPEEDLPIISGLGLNLAKIPNSRFPNFKEDLVYTALELINEIEADTRLREFKLKLVDVADPGNISFYFDALNVEIKIGSSDFKNRLKTVGIVLEQLGQDIDRVSYIDLRFENPIVGPR